MKKLLRPPAFRDRYERLIAELPQSGQAAQVAEALLDGHRGTAHVGEVERRRRAQEVADCARQQLRVVGSLRRLDGDAA